MWSYLKFIFFLFFYYFHDGKPGVWWAVFSGKSKWQLRKKTKPNKTKPCSYLMFLSSIMICKWEIQLSKAADWIFPQIIQQDSQFSIGIYKKLRLLSPRAPCSAFTGLAELLNLGHPWGRKLFNEELLLEQGMSGSREGRLARSCGCQRGSRGSGLAWAWVILAESQPGEGDRPRDGSQG